MPDYGPQQPIYIIFKHRDSGELLGPSVPFGVPGNAVYAVKTLDGWCEVSSEYLRDLADEIDRSYLTREIANFKTFNYKDA